MAVTRTSAHDIDWLCLSTDSKPSTLPNRPAPGEVLLETDTGDRFLYSGSAWVAYPTGGGGGGGGGDASAANQSLQITQETAVNTVIGLKTDAKSTATDTTSVSAVSVLKQISASVQAPPALAAGSALVGKVGIDQTTPGTTNLVSVASNGYSAAVTLTRTADTNAYAANDVLGAATGSTAALTFTSMGPSAGRIMLTGATFEIDATAIISGETSYLLHLYNITPPSALGDNTAFDLPSGDRASYLGSVNLGTPVDLGSTLYIGADAIGKPIKLSGTSLFGYLVTVGAYTPTSARVHVITLHAVGV